MSENGTPEGAEEQPSEQPKRHGAEHLAKHQWKKGVSGNAGGRKKGSKTLLQTMQEALDHLVPAKWVEEGLAEAGDTVRSVLGRRVVQAAALDPLNGTAGQMMRAIMDREDPKNTRLIIEDGTVASLAQACQAIEAGDDEALKEALGVSGEG